MSVGTVLFQIFAEQFLLLFDASAFMLEIGVPALRIISWCFPVAAVSIMFSTLFQAIGNGKLSLFVSACRQLAVILPVAYFLSQAFGLKATWWAYPIAEASPWWYAAFFWFAPSAPRSQPWMLPYKAA